MHDHDPSADVWEPRLPVEHGFPRELALALGQLRDFAASLVSDAVAEVERTAFDARAHSLRRELEALGLAVATARHAASRGPSRDAAEQHGRETVAAFMAREPSELDYLREVEELARTVADEAIDRYGSDLYEVTADDRSWIEAIDDPAKRAFLLARPVDPDVPPELAADPLVRALSSLAKNIRRYHWDGDGCLEED